MAKKGRLEFEMRRIDSKWAPVVYGVIQSGLTTAVAAAVSTFRLTTSPLEFLQCWPAAWGIAWLAMLPLVVSASPHIHRLARALVAPDRDPAD